MEYYYEDNSLIIKLKGKLHERIILYYANYKNHIKYKHTEITMKKIEEILKEPDYIYKPSKNNKYYYYEKNFGLETYRVVIGKYKRHVKCVITAYNIKDEGDFTVKHALCVYDKNTYKDYEDIQKELENDIDYFYEIFNIAE
ncbi:MAG: hypothetical protein GX275_04975 [Clostridiales bacterium]|nr:hypothetical protein [Clostridiales bacterium]